MKLEVIKPALDKIQGVTFASMDTITPVTLSGGKKNYQQGRVTKHTSNNQVMIFTNQATNGYEAMVRRRLEEEGKNPDSFTLGPLPWGTRIPNSPLIEHKGENYIQVIFNNPGKSIYMLDGIPVKKEEIIGLNEKSQESNNQGLSVNNSVIVRTFKLDNIKAIRMMGEEILDEVSIENSLKVEIYDIILDLIGSDSEYHGVVGQEDATKLIVESILQNYEIKRK